MKKWKKKEANNLTKQMKSSKLLPVTSYDVFWYKPADIEQWLTQRNPTQ